MSNSSRQQPIAVDDQAIINIQRAFKNDDEQKMRSLYPSLFESAELNITAAVETQIIGNIRKDFEADDKRRNADQLLKLKI